MMRAKTKKTVFVAMSGGVDSTVAAALLKKQGYRVAGITMCFNLPDRANERASCCGQDAISEAQAAAQILEIPHYVLNFGKELRQYVIEDFIQEYALGRTPNPCVQCNRYIKFDLLLKKVRALGADFLATGHYARVGYSRIKKQWQLKKGTDQTKDQSYFLYRIAQQVLPFILFPVGHLTKSQVRALGQKYGLKNAQRKESQDICFIPGKGYQSFIKEHLKQEDICPGPICDAHGRVLGQHQGIAFYTIGQRDGLGIALGKPVYIYAINAKTNTIYVGDQNRLLARGLIADDIYWRGADFLKKKIEVKIKIRYNQSEVKAWVSGYASGQMRVDFQRPQRAVTPGQSVVCYHRDIVLGGGTIKNILNSEELYENSTRH